MSSVMDTLRGKPFYNDYNASKQYTQVVALPGRVEQAREFTIVQSMFLDFLKRLGDVTLKDGNVVEGCELNISDKTIQISAGKVYLHGLIREVPESKVTITGIGNEVIGVKLIQNIVTEADDNSLCDPAEGYDNYGQPGAYRLKETVEVTSNDAESATIYRLQDGTLMITENKPELDIVNDVLARRTYDEMGNYKVSGLNIIDKKENTDTLVKIAVESGKAYIKGYCVNKPSASNVWVPKSQATRKVISEPKIYHSNTKKYKLNNNPVKKIHQITAVVSVTQTITRGNVGGGSDYLPKNPVVDITEVKMNGTTYQKNIDYQLTADSIDWSPSGTEPPIGSSYTITWKYNKILTEETDFKLTNDGDNYFIDFTDISNDLPVDSSTMTIDYEFYLSRRDVVALDCQGNITVIKGEPNVGTLATPPIFNEHDYFRLGILTCPPNSNNITIVSNAITRMPVEKLHALMERIETLEYNQAVTDLDKAVLDSEPASSLKGVLTDSFVNLGKCDLSHTKWNASVDLTERAVTIPSTRKSVDLKITKQDDPEFKARVSGLSVTNKFTETRLLTQGYASETVLLNPYGVYAKNAILKLNPGVTTDVGEIRTIDGGTENIRKDLTNWQYYHGDNWAERERQNYLSQGWGSMSTSVTDTGYFNGSTTTMSSTMITETPKDRLIMFIPEQKVEVTVENVTPYVDNLKVTFDGTTVQATPSSTAYQGTQSGTLKSDGNGIVKGSFTIPKNVPTGTREVIVSNSTTGEHGEDTTVKAVTNFVAPGKVRDVERVVRRLNVVYKPYDPVAQSFQFEQDQFITSLGLFFSAKDPKCNVTVEIRNMVNGYPGNVQLGVAILQPSDIKTSSDSSAETKVTFKEPVFCEANTQYCLIATTDSNVTSLYVANLGDKDLSTGQFIVRQPYTSGVLFTSSNAITWTPSQAKDLKLTVYGAEFQKTGIALFDEEDVVANKLVLNSIFLLPKGTSCRWEYRLNGDSSWLPISPLVEVLLSTTSSKIQLRAQLNGTENVSPVLNTEANRMDTALNALKGTYLTRSVEMPQKFSTVKQIVDLAIPSGASATVKYCIESDTTDESKWLTATQKTVSPINEHYSRYTFEATVSDASQKFKARIDFATSSPSVIPKAKNFMNILK